MREVHILNLGAGVQSTALYLLFHRGEIPTRLDAAIFADTGEEPAGVYRHLEWLKSLGGTEIIIRKKIDRHGVEHALGDDLVAGMNSTGQRFAGIPAFTRPKEWDGDPREVGITRRQCSKEYKVEVIERAIRRDVLGLKPRQRIPKDVVVTQYIGISLDEAGRAERLRKRFKEDRKWTSPAFPLIERGWTRRDCQKYLEGIVPHETPRSACTFCPYHSNHEWRWLRDNDAEGWQRAVEVDQGLRAHGGAMNRKLDQDIYVHRQCVPLDEVNLDGDPNKLELFSAECEGVCGV